MHLCMQRQGYKNYTPDLTVATLRGQIVGGYQDRGSHILFYEFIMYRTNFYNKTVHLLLLH